MRRHNGNDSDPLMERELAVVDAALASKPVEAEFDDLAELVRAIRAERPQLRPGFATSLDAQARQGFRAAAAGGTPSKPSRRRIVPLAAASAASLVIVVTVVLSSGVFSGGGGSEPKQVLPETPAAGGRVFGQNGAPESAAPAGQRSARPKAVTDQAAPTASGGELKAQALNPGRTPKVLPHVRNRQNERAAALTLATPPDKVEDTADGVIEVTDRYEGFVLRSNVTGGDRTGAGATLELRIPSDRLQPALRDLSALAHVRSRTQSTQDITARFVATRSRLREAMTERRALLRQLIRATTPNEAASIRARLRLTNHQIAVARSNLRGLQNRVGFSKVAVTIEADVSASSGGGAWTPGDALDDAVGVLGVAAGVALISLAVAVPLAAIALLFLVAYRRIVRERRDRALDF
jgi:hypothetical protein